MKFNLKFCARSVDFALWLAKNFIRRERRAAILKFYRFEMAKYAQIIWLAYI